MVIDLGALIEDYLGDIRIKLEKHIIVEKIRKNILSCLYWSVASIFMNPLMSSEVIIPITSV